MKKLLISLLLLNIFANDVYASEYIGNYDISLSCDIKPSYSIKLPTSIDVTNNTTYFDYYVKADIQNNQILKIIFDSYAKVKNINDEIVNINVNQNKDSWLCSELTNTYQKYTITLDHDTLPAGTWSGDLNIMITLTGGTQ